MLPGGMISPMSLPLFFLLFLSSGGELVSASAAEIAKVEGKSVQQQAEENLVESLEKAIEYEEQKIVQKADSPEFQTKVSSPEEFSVKADDIDITIPEASVQEREEHASMKNIQAINKSENKLGKSVPERNGQSLQKGAKKGVRGASSESFTELWVGKLCGWTKADFIHWKLEAYRIQAVTSQNAIRLVNSAQRVLTHQWHLLVGIVVALILVAMLTRWLIHHVKKATDERHLYSFLGGAGLIKKRRAQAGVIMKVSVDLADISLDIYAGWTYIDQGLYVFGGAALAIPPSAGVLFFVYTRLAWSLAPVDHKLPSGDESHYYFEKKDVHGFQRPGLRDGILSALQVAPLFVAYNAYHEIDQMAWSEDENDDEDHCLPHPWQDRLRSEQGFNGVAEGFPSALLQTYALLCTSMSGNHHPGRSSLILLIVSILSSVNTLSKSLANLQYSVLPGHRITTTTNGFSSLALQGLLAIDVQSRLWIMACLVTSFRPCHADLIGVSNKYALPILAVQILMAAAVLKTTFRISFHDMGKANIVLSALVGFLCIPACTSSGTLLQMLMWQKMTACMRAMEVALCSVLVWFRLHQCQSEDHRMLIIFFFGAFICFCTTFVVLVIDRHHKWHHGVALIPAAGASSFEKVHWAAALGNIDALRQCRDKLASSDIMQLKPSFLAAELGHEAVLRFVWEVAPETLTESDDKGCKLGHLAAQNGHEAVLRFLWVVAPGTFIENNYDGEMPSHRAAENGHAAILRFLWEVAPDTLTANNQYGNKPSHLAAGSGHEHTLRFLCEVAPETLTASENDGLKPSHLAAQNGHEACLRFLWDVAPETLAAGDQNESKPSHFAAQNWHEACLRFLWEVAPETLTASGRIGWKPSHFAALNGHDAALRFLWEVAPETLTASAQDGMTSSYLAAAYGHEAALRFLWEVAPENLTAGDQNETKPSHAAAQNGHEACLRFLWQVAPDTLTASENDGLKPSHLAARNGHEACLRFLWDVAPETLAAGDHNEWKPSHWAVEVGHEPILRFLWEVAPETLAAGDQNERQPSHWAAEYGHEAILRFLWEVAPETLTASGQNERKPSHCAVEYGHEAILRFLWEVAPETLAAGDQNEAKPSHVAAQNGHEACLRFLWQVAPDTLTANNQYGNKPSHLAAEYGHEAIVRFLWEVAPETLTANNRKGENPSHCAAVHGHDAALRFLWEVAPETLTASTQDGKKPSHMAAEHGCEGCLRFLWEVAPETLAASDESGKTPLDYATDNGHEAVLHFCMEVAR